MTAGGFDGVERRGLMFVLSSPSGAGKTTLSRMLVAETPALQMSVSATTRPMRPGEVEGRDYFFVDRSRFEAMATGGELLEWATVFDNRYGTPRAPVEAALASGQDVLFDIDWQGTQQLRSRSPNDVVSVFILPPSVSALEQRLHTRAQDSDEVIRGRMRKAGDEMSHFDAYDYIVVNDNIGIAFEAVKSILRAEQLKRERQIGLSGFVQNLQRQLKKYLRPSCLRATRQPRQHFGNPPLRNVRRARIGRNIGAPSRHVIALRRRGFARKNRRRRAAGLQGIPGRAAVGRKLVARRAGAPEPDDHAADQPSQRQRAGQHQQQHLDRVGLFFRRDAGSGKGD